MTKKLITVDIQSTLADAIKRMIEKDIGSIVVTQEGKPVGIVTERDVLKEICVRAASCDVTKVEEIMSTPLITIDIDTPIGDAARIMDEKKIRRLLVTEDDEVKGIVTQRDLMRGTLEVFHALTWK